MPFQQTQHCRSCRHCQGRRTSEYTNNKFSNRLANVLTVFSSRHSTCLFQTMSILNCLRAQRCNLSSRYHRGRLVGKVGRSCNISFFETCKLRASWQDVLFPGESATISLCEELERDDKVGHDDLVKQPRRMASAFRYLILFQAQI